MVKVKINVSGIQHEFNRSILNGKENDTLSKMCEDADEPGTPVELFVDRPVECFTAILGYYQTGELHMPQTVCPKAFKKELEFWGVSATILQPCCFYRYFTFFSEYETREKFRAEFVHETTSTGSDIINVVNGNKLSRWKSKIWNVIDFKERTFVSKIYFAIICLMVLLCIMTLALSTVKTFHRHVNQCEMLEYLQYSDNDDYDTVYKQFGSPDCVDYEGGYIDYYYYFDYNTTYGVDRVQLPTISVRVFVLDVLEYIAAGFFTLDLLLRLASCPSLLGFMKSILNLFDILAVVAFYLNIIMLHAFMKDQKYTMNWVKAIGYVQIFRVMRLFRIARNVRASRVLVFSLRSNAKDMVLLLLLLIIVVSFFGSLIFFIENGHSITSIPEAWYWTVITITTVGYGDLSPVTAAGRVVAAILSICGVLLLSITLPMFVNSFLSLYQYSCMSESHDEIKLQEKLIKTTQIHNNQVDVLDVPGGPTDSKPAKHSGEHPFIIEDCKSFG